MDLSGAIVLGLTRETATAGRCAVEAANVPGTKTKKTQEIVRELSLN
jgi:hypothetical protein